jgi:electron transport complex, rnfABCDGE type, B subunit
MIEISKIEEILPQTQCRQCGYHDCADYAKAIANGEQHNRCPAGGPQVISRLSALLGREELSLNEECGVHVPPEIAEIDPNKCIGCGICTTKCEFDAIHLKRVRPQNSKMIPAEDKFKAIGPYAAKRQVKIIKKSLAEKKK